MDKYDLSCFELSAGSTFDESTIKSGQSTFITTDTNSKFVCFSYWSIWKFAQKITHFSFQSGLYETNTNAPPVIEPMKTIPAKNMSRTSTPIIDETKIESSQQQMSSISQNEKPNLSPSGELNKTDTTQEIESSKINISTETIYLILTGKLDLCHCFWKI